MNPWKNKIMHYNRRRVENDERATDLLVLIEALQPEHIEQLQAQPAAAAVLAKYGLIIIQK